MSNIARHTVKARKDQAVRLSGKITYTLVPNSYQRAGRQVRAGAVSINAR